MTWLCHIGESWIYRCSFGACISAAPLDQPYLNAAAIYNTATSKGEASK